MKEIFPTCKHKYSNISGNYGQMKCSPDEIIPSLHPLKLLLDCTSRQEGVGTRYKIKFINQIVHVKHAGAAVLGGAAVFELGPGQWFDVICSLVAMPGGFALFEGCRLSRVPRCSLSMAEASLKEDETAWHREVNEDLLCLQVIFTSWWIIQRLLRTTNYHRVWHTYMHARTRGDT